MMKAATYIILFILAVFIICTAISIVMTVIQVAVYIVLALALCWSIYAIVKYFKRK